VEYENGNLLDVLVKMGMGVACSGNPVRYSGKFDRRYSVYGKNRKPCGMTGVKRLFLYKNDTIPDIKRNDKKNIQL
jgi:hypothetical protein